jgi:hypothetical protein
MPRWQPRLSPGRPPIVFMTADDPIEDGLVVSFNHPGGNATGISIFNAELVASRSVRSGDRAARPEKISLSPSQRSVLGSSISFLKQTIDVDTKVICSK